MNIDDVVKGKRYDDGNGIALYFVQREMETEVIYEHFEGDEWHDDEFVAIDEVEVETGMVIMCMVGDDRNFPVDPDNLEEVTAEDYCSECGQRGCKGDGR